MPNIVARFDAARPGRHLVLNGHIDIFPANDHEWTRSPWSGEIVDGRIHGRGACDMKGGLASLTLAFLHLHALRDQLRGRLTYTAVSDEETFGPWGARYLFEHHRDLLMGDCLLSGEPSSPECVRFGEKSPYWIAITVRTRGAHGAYTHASASATKIAGQVDAGARGAQEAADPRTRQSRRHVPRSRHRRPGRRGLRRRPFGGHPRDHAQPGPHFRRPEDEHDARASAASKSICACPSG